jgi:predicted ATPase
MSGRPVTISEAIAALDTRAHRCRKDSSRAVAETRQAAAAMQGNAKLVMFDRRQVYDPADALLMMLIATEHGHMLRVPISRTEARALDQTIKNEGG